MVVHHRQMCFTQKKASLKTDKQNLYLDCFLAEDTGNLSLLYLSNNKNNLKIFKGIISICESSRFISVFQPMPLIID